MSNSIHAASIYSIYSSRSLFILGSIFALSSGILNAGLTPSEPTQPVKGPLTLRVLALPMLPGVPPDESDSPCDNLKTALKNRINPLPVIDWLNIINLPSFFEPTIRSLLKREEYYNQIDTLGKYDVGAQPYGFFSSYNLEKNNFKLTTFGMTVDGGITLYDRWVVGGGLGYWHSNLDWGKHFSKNTANSVYCGPYAGYIFDKAYIGMTLLGVYNIYKINHLLGDLKKESHPHGWDLATRLEGAYDYEWSQYFGENFFIQPNIDLNYFWAFQNKIKETREFSEGDKLEATVDSRNYSFLRSRLGITFKKEFHHEEKGILIPSLSIAWVLMQPLSKSEVDFTCSGSDKEKVKTKAYPSSNQCYLAAKIIAVNKWGLLFSLGGEAYFANLYPVYAGTFRFEWDW